MLKVILKSKVREGLKFMFVQGLVQEDRVSQLSSLTVVLDTLGSLYFLKSLRLLMTMSTSGKPPRSQECVESVSQTENKGNFNMINLNQLIRSAFKLSYIFLILFSNVFEFSV